MTRRRIFLGVGGVAVFGAVAFALAWATGLIFAGPSQSAWAATVCSATATDPLDEAPWGVLTERFDEAILLLEEAELPGGTEEFHATAITALQRVRTQLNGFARSNPHDDLSTLLEQLEEISATQPRGPSGDGAVSVFYSTIRNSEALIRAAADSLPSKSRAAIEDVPGCGERLLA